MWDRFFDGTKIHDLQADLEGIRNYRNNVAHSKYFYLEDYINCKSRLKKIFGEMDNAIEEIEKRNFSDEEIGESLKTLAETLCFAYRGIYESWTPFAKVIAEAIKQANIDIWSEYGDVIERYKTSNIWAQYVEQINPCNIANQILSEHNAQMEKYKKAMRINLPQITNGNYLFNEEMDTSNDQNDNSNKKVD